MLKGNLVPMEYWQMNIGKFNEFNFLNEEVEEFISSWNQNWLM